jgi:periplasmic protein CpxP/Spy
MRNRLIPVLLLAMAWPGTMALAHGDDKPGYGDKPPKLERMVRELGLSPDQKIKVKAILDYEHAKKTALKQETEDKLKTVLTKEQFSKLEKK